ncbi:MAG: hypothetical protein SNJ31_06870 [Rikenellaceae bacterium]
MKSYIQQLNSLKTAKIAGVIAPHKPILLLSIIDLIERGLLINNQIQLSEALEKQFKHNWSRYVGDSILFQPKIATPYWHMSGESFWKLVSQNGEELTKENFQGSPYSSTNLRKQVKYAEIEQELFDLLQKENVRADFRVLLIKKYLGTRHFQKSDVLPILITIGSSVLPIAS